MWMWSLIVVAVLLAFVQVRICPQIIFICPRCKRDMEGRRCYSCRIEVEPDDTPSEMRVFEALSFFTRHFINRRIRGQRLEWHSF